MTKAANASLAERRAQVVVVGAGPSGLTVAAELALQGCEVVVLERRENGVQSRAGTVLPRVLELLDYRGMAQSFIEQARRIRENPLIPFHIWSGLQPIWWSYLGSAFGYRLVLPQNETEDLLRQRAIELGVKINYGATVSLIQQHATEVVVTADLATGSAERWIADYVVGADGGRSAVRHLLGLPFNGHDGTFTGIIADVRVNMHWPEGRAMVDNEHGWAASFPFGEGGEITRFNLVHAKRRYADKSEPVTAEEVRSCLEDIFESKIEFTELIWSSRFTDAMRAVENLRKDRVFLVGESARIHYPASGVGMNFCIQDAFNLGWKLGRVVTGKSPDSILDTYDLERAPVMQGLLHSVQAQTAIQFNFTMEGIALKRFLKNTLLPMPDVNRAIALELNGLTNPYPASGQGHVIEGRPVPEFSLQTAEGIKRVAEFLRTGQFVLVDLTGGSSLFQCSSGSVVYASGRPVGSPASLAGLTAILIRPDGYVHWSSSSRDVSTSDVKQALSGWI